MRGDISPPHIFMEKLYIIDALNVIFRSYYAIGPMTDSHGQSTGALFGFIRTLQKLMRDFSPTHMVVVFDGPDNKAMRTALYEDYKKHRVGMPEDLFPQLELAREFCQKAGLPQLEVPGVEADDTMGSIAQWAGKKNAKVFICTTDKDMCQIVNDKIHLLNVYKDNLHIDPAKVLELHGVRPDQIIDLLALMGDTSDNIPGIAGIGPKTAAKWLQEFGTLDELLAHPEKIPGAKKQQAVIEGKENALISRKLATLHLDVPFPQNESFFFLEEPRVEEIKSFYKQLNFLSLLKEVDASLPPPIDKTPIDYKTIDDETTLHALVEELTQAPTLVIDTETTHLHPLRAQLVGLSFSQKSGQGWYVPMNGQLGKARALALLRPLFISDSIGWIAHNMKYDLHVLKNEGVDLPKIAFDTMVASYLVSPHNPRHNLDQLSLEKFGKVKIPIEQLIGKGQKQISMAEVAIEKVAEYACEDADYTFRLYELFLKELQKHDLTTVMQTIELPLLPVLFKMERRGIHIDLQKIADLSKELHQELDEIRSRIFSFAGMEFNLNSPKQLGEVLFEKLQIKGGKKTATGYSTSADVLENLKDASPIMPLLMQYRLLEKLRSTYVDSLPHEVLPPSNHIHCTFNQSVAATGRLSCQNPNLQNIPIRSLEGRKIRTAFIPSQPSFSLVSADYSQIELRLLAHLSEDPALITAFAQGEDVHAYTASLVFNIPLHQVSDDMRHVAKAVNYGILYGQSAFGLSQQLTISPKEASSFIDTYFQRYGRVKDFLEFCKESVRKLGYALTITGRKRPIPDIHNKNAMIRAAAERLAVNTPLQGAAADLIKLAMIELDQRLEEQKELGSLLLQIHDELILEGPDTSMTALAELTKSCMQSVMKFKVPLVVDISIGKNWGEC